MGFSRKSLLTFFILTTFSKHLHRFRFVELKSSGELTLPKQKWLLLSRTGNLETLAINAMSTQSACQEVTEARVVYHWIIKSLTRQDFVCHATKTARSRVCLD